MIVPLPLWPIGNVAGRFPYGSLSLWWTSEQLVHCSVLGWAKS